MANSKWIFILLFTFTALIGACDKEDPIIPNEEEVITTLYYTLIPDSGGAVVVFSFRDLDGDGGNEPVIQGGVLTANTVYSGELVLLNELNSPVDTISNEIREEELEHQFFFQSSTSALNIEYDDIDQNGYPLGLQTKVTTADTTAGTLTLVLRHEPVKTAQGVADGDISQAGGETDIEVTFDIDVQ